MKKVLKSIKEWALGVFTLIIKTVAPVWTVKYLTVWFAEGRSWYKADAKEKARLFLPGVKAEVKAIQKLNLTEDQLKRRVWSDGTCEELLRLGDSSLYFLAKSDEAYDLIIKTGDAKVIAGTFRTNTPSVAYLKSWLKTADETLVLAVIAEAPSIFNDVKFNDIKRAYAKVLVGYSDSFTAERWAKRIFEGLVNYCCLQSEELSEERELFDKAMEILVETDFDFTKFLDQMASHHRDWYGTIRVKASQSGHAQAKHLVSYIKERIPNVWYNVTTIGEYESGHKPESFEENYCGECRNTVNDARAWLQLAYKKLSNQEVVKVCLDHITDLTYGNPCGAFRKMQERLVEKVAGYELIKYALTKLPEQYKSALQSKLYQSISSYVQARECMHGSSKEEIVRIKAFPKSYRKGLRAKLVKCTCTSDTEAFIRTYWPFLNWEAENAEAAVRKLAQLKALPLDKLGELSDELRIAGLEEVDITAEQDCLLVNPDEYSHPSVTQEELLKRRIHPRSEESLFTRGYHWQDVKLKYISSFRMSERGFQALVNYCGSDSGDAKYGVELIRAHAEKWGLTEGEYLLLCKSPYYSGLAAPLKGCNPVEAPAESSTAEDAAAEAPVEEPNNDEKSE